MCFVSPNREDMPLFKEALFKSGATKEIIYEDLGKAIFNAANIWTTAVQPYAENGELVYGITQHGSEDLIIVRDGDDYTDLEIPEYCTSVIPITLSKALALSAKVDAQIREELNINEDATFSTKYNPQYTPLQILKKRRMESLSYPKWRIKLYFIVENLYIHYRGDLKELFFFPLLGSVIAIIKCPLEDLPESAFWGAAIGFGIGLIWVNYRFYNDI